MGRALLLLDYSPMPTSLISPDAVDLCAKLLQTEEVVRGMCTSPWDRVFLNLWFAKPMVWVRVAFHENDGNDENDENDEDNSDCYKQGVECWIRGNHGNHENDENHENPGCKPRVPQTTGLEIPDGTPAVDPCLSRRVSLGHPAGVPRISLNFMCLFLSGNVDVQNWWCRVGGSKNRILP